MSSNLSDSKQERELFNRISRLEKQMREMRTLQLQGSDALNIALNSEVYTDTVTIDSEWAATWEFTLYNDEPVFLLFEYNLYYHDPGPGDIGGGIFYTIFPFIDYQVYTGDPNKQVHRVILQNTTEMEFEFSIEATWRYLLSGPSEELVQSE